MKHMNNKSGFTLVEILTAVIIVAILTVMAMPLYEKTVERSRMAEARTIMNRLQAAKLYAMDNMGCNSYSTSDTKCPQLQHLNMALVDNQTGKSATGTSFQTKDFEYSIAPTGCLNGISAKRIGNNEYKGATFIYYGLRQDGGDTVFACTSSDDLCEAYGLTKNSATNLCS
ncbi:MAG: prepilin-type N-terminal cleavage/methylation domain-containing protein [Elusimicrobiaceae bacterium]|nr:prepilin-type N-terminal cleavage/methylation domain-containing protein [Elusimicrobiaceae bacterium]